MKSPEQDLFDVFEAGAQSVPDPHEVVAGVYTGIARRRQRRRTFATAGLAASILAAALVTTNLTTAGNGTPEQVQAADAEPLKTTWHSTLKVGWLPAGMAKPSTTYTKIAETILYPGTATAPYLSVGVDNIKWDPKPTMAGWQPIEINGRQGREISRPTRTIIEFPLASGRWASLEFGVGMPGEGPNGQPATRESAVRIAKSLSEDGDTALEVGFAPTYLPAGHRVIGVGTAGSPGQGDIIAASGSLRLLKVRESNGGDGITSETATFDLGAGTNIRVTPFDQGYIDGSTRIADIQGKPAYELNRGLMVVVTDFHGGMLVVTATTDGAMAFKVGEKDKADSKELVKVAEGVRWRG